MKRQILILVSALVLMAGAAFAQSTINTTAPGPTQQQEPGQTNNNLPNPGHPIPVPNQNPTVKEQGTLQGTASESMQRSQSQGTSTGTMGTGSGMAPETENGQGMDVDVDTGSRAQGAVDVDVTRTTDSDTDASGTGVQTTGQYNGMNGTAGDTGTLPSTASNLPSLALMGLLFLSAAFALRVYAKRNA